MDTESYAKGYDAKLSVIDNCVEILRQTNNMETLEHVAKVGETGIEIANRYGLDKNKVETACYLHDISKIIPQGDYIKLCENNNIEVLDVEREVPMLLHQKVSKLIAEKIFNISDEEILSSIESHTTLRANPSDIDMAVFIADKISWDQEGLPPYLDGVLEALKSSLEKACLEHINFRLNNNMILIPHPMLLEAKADLEKGDICE